MFRDDVKRLGRVGGDNYWVGLAACFFAGLLMFPAALCAAVKILSATKGSNR